MISRHISVVIAQPVSVVYEYASNPDNLPKWASGLAQSEVERVGDALMVDSPMGRISFKFAPNNEFGVLDHDVTMPSGEVSSNRMRVIDHPEGSEIIFTLRQNGGSDEDFDADTNLVQTDFAALKKLLEA